MNPISTSSQSLMLPLTFPTISNLGQETAETQHLLETSCSAAEPSLLFSWGLTSRARRLDAEHSGGDRDDDHPTKGAAMGCKDGTLYIFLPTPTGGQVDSEDIQQPFEPPGASDSTSRTVSAPPVTLLTQQNGSYLQGLSLRCHVIPPRTRPRSSITGMQLIDGNRVLVTLQTQGELSVFNLKDGSCICTTQIENPPLQSHAGVKHTSHTVWAWSSLQVVDTGQQSVTVLLVRAKADINLQSASSLDAPDDDTDEQSRLVTLECRIHNDYGSPEARIDKIGEWHFDGPVNGVGVRRESDDTLGFIYLDSKRNLVAQQAKRPLVPPAPEPHLHESNHGHLSSLPLPNPFKSIMSRSAEHIPLESKVDASKTGLVERDMGQILSQGTPSGFRTRTTGSTLRGIAWSTNELAVFEYEGDFVRPLFASPITGIRGVAWIDDDSYAITFLDRCELYALKTVDGNNDDVQNSVVLSESLHVQSQLVHAFSLGSFQALHFVSASEVLFTRVDKDGRRNLVFAIADSDSFHEPGEKSCVVWKASHQEGFDTLTKAQVTSVLPLEFNKIILGYDDGRIRQSAFLLMAQNVSSSPIAEMTSETALDGFIAALYLVQNGRTKERFVLGGADDGSIAFWSLDSLQLRARWISFTSPLLHVIQFHDEKVGPLQGCVLCLSMDGTIAVIVVDGFQFLYLIPGSVAPLKRLCVGGDNLLLIYRDDRARLWGIKTRGFWRSMGLDKAEELISQGGWTVSSTEAGENFPDTSLSSFAYSKYQGVDSVSTILLNLERFISDTTAAAKTIGVGPERKRLAPATLGHLRSVLSTLLTPTLSDEIDEICCKRLGIIASPVSLGFSSRRSVSLYCSNRGRDVWCISPDVSAARALSIVVVLRVLALFEELSEDANTVMSFYATSLASTVGPSYQAPSLVFLAQRWFDASNDVRQAARILFDSAVIHLSDQESHILVEKWKHHLPCLQPTAEQESLRAALALFICGYVAAEKYSLLSTGILTDISKSITIYLYDEHSMYRVLAIDLCSRGFTIWQNHVDVMEILRALFTLATNASKQAITVQNLGAQSRLAILQIASSNTSLFMTTLGLDILHPQSVEHRKSVMQIVAFLIRRRPLVLYPNLPRLMEAVVKSLDPNATASRDAVLDTATEIIGHVVKTFPTIDFHMTSQRLAVGTNEGAIVMYDLKTATRLFVLEGHQKRLAACSFSPDGRRLVTVSLEESVVLVWKVGASFSSFFNPGAPPRQGSGGSLPFKTLSFNVGDEANMTVEETFEWVRFEWVAERSVKLKIRDSVLTFST